LCIFINCIVKILTQRISYISNDIINLLTIYRTSDILILIMNVDPSAMTVRILRQELESLGIDTRSFLEKSEFIDALVTARKGANQLEGGPSPSLASDSEAAVCYLCLDGGDDEAGQPMRRDCACRGTDAGFVHLSCLTNYAETKSVQAHGMREFVTPWCTCPSCHQDYQNELAIDIATKFVSFVRRQYPDNTQRQVESLYVKLSAFNSMFGRLQPVQKREAGVTADVLLSLIDRLKNDASLTREYSIFAAYAYSVHGRIALKEGTKESARRAEAQYENQLKICEAIGFAEGIMASKSNIAAAKSMYEGGRNEEVLKAKKDVYKFAISELGEESEHTIRAGLTYACHLHKASRGDEATELCTKLLSTSKQVLGPHHNTTQEVASALKWISVRLAQY
jgi:hypothetical protein